MGTTTANMGLSKPTLGGDAGTWDDQNNATIDKVDAHRHVPGEGVAVPTAGLNINADLTFAGNALTNVKAMAFATQASYTVSKSLWVKTSDNELYWRNGSGIDVKMTSGGTLNVASVGGIVGDYAAVGAAVYYDDTAQAYRFLEAAPLPNSWSRVQCGDLDLYEHASGISNRVRIASPTGLAASYAITLPAALPASTSVMHLSAAGAVTATNALSITTLAVSSTTTLTGTSTHNGGIVVPSGQTLDINGVADLAGATSLKLPARILGLEVSSGAVAVGTATVSTYVAMTVTPTSYDLSIPLHEGDRITAVKFYYARNSGTSIGFSLLERTMTGGSTTLASRTISTGTGDANADFTTLTTGSLPQTLAANKTYAFQMAGGNTDRLYGAFITWDRP